ncbi:ankyrin repeat domain-containing protein [Leptolyngbya sp. 7M]|uniref:ankyrin repeat domain-containing protein n=1 Tax=Leptolyngbya sp. 7M TaxID=2812896 RepID=UPI001B8B6519|nr:ankyrin repeat domain-containing protein [Leptolyngbya sp. 7M]QYO63538.1 ankyrin repeat domain-containing protein [Leptolyngbya sp. 7M]
MGHAEIVKLFIEAGANVIYIREEGTPLHYAVRGDGMPAHIAGENLRHAEVVKVLIDAGTDLSVTDDPKFSNYHGWTPLMTAACYGRVEIARILIEAGAKIDARDKSGKTPLIIAAEFGSVGVVDLLVQAGAKIVAKDSKGCIAFDYVSNDFDAASVSMEDELKPMQAFQQLKETSMMGDAQTMIPQLFDLLGNVEELEKSRQAEVARILYRAGAE